MSIASVALVSVSLADSLRDESHRLKDVPAAIGLLPSEPKGFAIKHGTVSLPEGGHLQGIQLWTTKDEKRRAILSGSSNTISYLVSADLERGKEEEAPQLITLLKKPFKHAGGFQIVGDYLAVGIEDNDAKTRSKVWILDLLERTGSEAKPVIEIQREGPAKRSTAGAVGMAKVGERHLLVVGSWDSATLDFYESNGKLLSDPKCSFELKASWIAKEADRSGWSDEKYGSYQNINLMVEDSGRVYLAGFCQTGPENILDLFTIDFDDLRDANPSKLLKKVTSRSFECHKTSFRAGAGLSSQGEGRVSVVSCSSRGWTVERFQPIAD